MIHDRAMQFDISVLKSALANPKFDICQWYVKHWIEALNLKCFNTHHNLMDAAINDIATKLLIDGIASSYLCTNPNLDPEDQFYVHLVEHGSNEYVINDIDLEVFPQILKVWLEELSFNLVGWYQQYIDQGNKFE